MSLIKVKRGWIGSRKYELKLENVYFSFIKIDIIVMFVFVIFSWWNFETFFILKETFWSLLLIKKKNLVINKIVLLKKCLIFIFIFLYP